MAENSPELKKTRHPQIKKSQKKKKKKILSKMLKKKIHT